MSELDPLDRPTHNAWRGPNQGYAQVEWTPCYCPATQDHAVGKEQMDPDTTKDPS